MAKYDPLASSAGEKNTHFLQEIVSGKGGYSDYVYFFYFFLYKEGDVMRISS